MTDTTGRSNMIVKDQLNEKKNDEEFAVLEAQFLAGLGISTNDMKTTPMIK